MKYKEFDTNYWEENWKNVSLPQVKNAENIHELHHIFKKTLPEGHHSIIEIGCAPGSYLTYFFNFLKFSISGIENAPKACEKTIENLKLLRIPCEIFLGDFFKFVHEPYDIVFSAGFIEHFKEVKPVINKKVNLCSHNKGHVITIIPSMEGFNRWISKTFRPHIAAGHFPISKSELIQYHEECGLKTCYCDYISSLHILQPMEKNNFSFKHPLISKCINKPFNIWNQIINYSTMRLHFYPKLSWLTKSIIYIGQKIN